MFKVLLKVIDKWINKMPPFLPDDLFDFHFKTKW